MNRSRCRLISLPLALCLVLLVNGPVPAVAAPAASVQSLATAWAHAHSTAQRVHALQSILRALGIAVMDPTTGGFTVQGTPRAEQEDYLYSNELTALALAAAAHRTVPLATVAGAIDAAGYTDAGMPVTPASLGAALTSAGALSRHAGAANGKGWLGIKLVRAIGLAHGSDIATTVPTALDPLQAVLVVQDFTLPATAHLAVAGSGSALPASTAGLVKRVTPPKTRCAQAKPLPGQPATVQGALAAIWAQQPSTSRKALLAKGSSPAAVASRIAALIKAVDHAKAAVKLRDGQHGVSAESDVNITTQAPPMPIALGSPSVQFRAKVVVDLTLHTYIVRCGYLTGIDFHARGPVAGAEVSWDPGGLDQWGTLAPDGPSPVTLTDKDGWSDLTFSPDKDLSDSGDIVEEKGTATTGVKVAGSTASEQVPWVISHHEPQVTLTYDAHVTASGSCSGPNCPSADASGTDSSQFDAGLAATASMTMPLDGTTGWRAQGTTTETLTEDEDANTFQDAVLVGCPEGFGDGNSQSVGTGTDAGPFYVDNLGVDVKAHTVALVFSFLVTDENPNDEVSENVHSTYTTTAPSDCTGSESFDNTVSTAGETVRYFQSQDNPPSWGNTYLLTVPTTAWQFSPTWSAAKGGTLATGTATFSETDPGDGTSNQTFTQAVTETFTLSTQPPQ